MFTPGNNLFSFSRQQQEKGNSCSYINISNGNWRFNSIIALGNPIVDISAEVDKESLEKYNLEWGGTVFANQNNVGFFTDLESRPQVTYIPGGSIQNTLRVAAWRLSKEFGKNNQFSLTMLGAVGEDKYKEKIMNALKMAGVTPLLQEIQNSETSRCGVAIYKKERCLLPQIRASNCLSMDFIKKNREKIDDNNALLIEGYFLQEKFDICKELCQDFSENEKFIILTLSSVFIVKAHKEKVQEISNYANMIVGNMDEFREFADTSGENYREIFEKAANMLSRKNDRLFVITNGKKPTLVAKYDYDKENMENILYSYTDEMNFDEIVDLNGAGDAFLGGFLAQYMKGSKLTECCRVGNDVASIILKNVGCTFQP